MPMLSYFGITELIGGPGSGKTALAIEEAKIYKTFYITSTNFPIDRIDFSKAEYGNIYIEFIQTTGDLMAILSSKLRTGIFLMGIELIVIDNLFHIVFLDSRSNKEVTNLIYILKRLIQKYKIKVLVINTCCFKTMDQNRVSFISKLGLNWEYHVNAKYLCKKVGEDYSISLIKSPTNQKLSFVFKISKSCLEIVQAG